MIKAQTTVRQLDWMVGGAGTAAYANAFGLRFYSIRGTEGNWYLEYPKDGALFVHEGLETQIAARRAAQAHYEALVRFELVFQPSDDGGESSGFSIELDDDALAPAPQPDVQPVSDAMVDAWRIAFHESYDGGKGAADYNSHIRKGLEAALAIPSSQSKSLAIGVDLSIKEDVTTFFSAPLTTEVGK